LVTRKLIDMAQLHEERGRELLLRRDFDGWTDWFAAITAWAEAGRLRDARRLVAQGYHFVGSFVTARDDIEHHLGELDAWMGSLSFDVQSLSQTSIRQKGAT